MVWVFFLSGTHSSIMAAASISLPGSAAPGPEFEDYSVYSNLSDDELLQLAIERSLNDTHDATFTAASPAQSCDSCSNCPAKKVNPPADETSAHYSSPNPPRQKPPDPYVTTSIINYILWRFNL